MSSIGTDLPLSSSIIFRETTGKCCNARPAPIFRSLAPFGSYMDKKSIHIALCIASVLLAAVISLGNTEINPSLPFEQQSLYLRARNALATQDYAEARKLISELSKIDPYKARSLRSLGIIETNFDLDDAIKLFKESYDLGDKESFSLYLNALAKAGRFDELTAYHPDIFAGAFYNRYMFETYCLIAEHFTRKEEKQAFLLLARRVPLEIAVGNLNFLKLLIKYGEPEDKLVVDFLNREIHYSHKSEIGGVIPKAPLTAMAFHPPDRATVENYQKTDEYKHYLKFINGRNLNADDAISKLSILAKKPQYQILVNADLAYIALKESDLLRVDQLCEVSVTIGDLRMTYPLFTSLIVQNNLKNAKKYEKQFFEYTFSRKPDTNLAVFAKYCLLTDNKEMFLKWVRSSKWELMLENFGRKKLFLEGLEKWGQDIDRLLINYLKERPPKSDYEMDFSFVWGIPHKGTLVPMGGEGIKGLPQLRSVDF